MQKVGIIFESTPSRIFFISAETIKRMIREVKHDLLSSKQRKWILFPPVGLCGSDILELKVNKTVQWTVCPYDGCSHL